MELSNTFVILMGLGTVFIGLICIIAICYVMSYVVQKITKPTAPVSAPVTEVTPAPAKSTITNRQEFIAAVSAVIAEELGTDVSAIRILSVKEL
ncbi:MAG: OadG family protein [Cellulosilyticum sp.]|nr:OadG family protein [Cellulosilyticum sp.]